MASVLKLIIWFSNLLDWLPIYVRHLTRHYGRRAHTAVPVCHVAGQSTRAKSPPTNILIASYIHDSSCWWAAVGIIRACMKCMACSCIVRSQQLFNMHACVCVRRLSVHHVFLSSCMHIVIPAAFLRPPVRPIRTSSLLSSIFSGGERVQQPSPSSGSTTSLRSINSPYIGLCTPS